MSEWLRCCCGCLTWCTDSNEPLDVEAEVTGEMAIQLLPKTSTVIEVRWAEQGQEMYFYKIRYRRAVGPGKWKFLKPERGANRCLLTNLHPDTEYELQIENKSFPPDQQEYSRSVFASTRRGTASDRARDSERSRLLPQRL